MNIRHLPLLLICILGTIISSISYASEVDNWEMYAPVRFEDIQIYNGKLAITTSYTGLIIYDPVRDEFQQLTKINSELHSNFLSRLLVDSQNRLWVGTYDNGVAMLQNGNWIIYDTTITPFKNGVGNIKEGLNSSIWFLKYNQVIEFQNGEWIQHDSLLLNSPLDHFYDITFDSAGGFWAIGSPSNTIGYFNGNEWFEYTQYDSCHCFGSIEEINYSRNKLWVLTYSNGLFVLQDSIWTEYSRNTNHLIGQHYRDILLTSDSTCWVLSDSGLSYFDSYSWTNYSFINYGLNTDKYDPYKISALNDSIVVGYFNYSPQGIFIFEI